MIFDFRFSICKKTSRSAVANRQSSIINHQSQRGVALIVTLIMLAVITFMATTFLVLSRRERNSVSTNTDQTTARFAADHGLERAKVQLLGGIIAENDDQNFDLMVPTNFFNPRGFDPAAVDYRTNVNYNYDKNGNPLTAAQQQQNIANLLYDPRPPVYITNQKVTNDFRFYYDLNRNGRFDDTGSISNVYYNALGVLTTNGNIGVVGDPQWIGVLRFPDRPHSADNPFESRWTYLVLPAGKTLDVNYLHNYAKRFNPAMTAGVGDGFVKNEGVGPWEINLAAFLADLNTNVWQPITAPYNYAVLAGLPAFTSANTGTAFDDALSLLRHRYNSDYRTLQPLSLLIGPNPAATSLIIGNDRIDQYGDGAYMATTALPTIDNNDATLPWSGADNPNHFFTPQDFFDPGKASLPFVNHLQSTGFQPDSYNRYTFYRMLAQLGTDSSPPVEDRINVNYRNVTNGVVVPGMETNLMAWTPLEFFTNAAARMFQKLDIRDNYGNLITVTNIPVWAQATNFIRNNLYTPDVHRVLQLAANIYDATGQTNGIYPSIFRPFFSSYLQGGTNRVIYISGYIQVNGPNDTATDPAHLSIPLDLNKAADNASILTTPTLANVYGAPWVIGAKKGFPNLNQIALQSVSQMTRKMLVYRPLDNNDFTTYRGKQMFIVGVSNKLDVEVWNSYNTNYPRLLYIRVDGNLTVRVTNNMGINAITSFAVGGAVLGATNIPAGKLLGTGLRPNGLPPPSGTSAASQPNKGSFVVPLQTNMIVLKDSVQIGGGMFVADATSTAQWNAIPYDNLSDPHWGMMITNNLRCYVMDEPGGRVVDYVQLNQMETVRDLSGEAIANDTLNVWKTNANTATLWATVANPISEGALRQILISMDTFPTGPADWSNNGLSSGTKAASILAFQQFMNSPTVSSNIAQVPFTPTAKYFTNTLWQANDPLVHYLSQDLAPSGNGQIVRPPNAVFLTTNSLFVLNNTYSPWGGYGPKTGWDIASPDADPHMFDTAMRDPLVRSSDDWNFPTNKFPSIGWLGRVHRGSPWQTVYMKAGDILSTDVRAWQKMSGSANYFMATNIAPIKDRQLFEVFTTSISDNASRGQLSINQTNLAAWSAVLSGVIVLTNDPPTLSYGPEIISPAGVYTPGVLPLPPLVQIVEGINRSRTNFNRQTFDNLGDFLATPELTDVSPYLITNKLQHINAGGISDEVLERIPQQVMSLLTISHEPRFVIYSYGQTLHPANSSVVTFGAFNGLCTNYQVTAETATRAVVRVEGAPRRPRIVVEQYNVLPPD